MSETLIATLRSEFQAIAAVLAGTPAKPVREAAKLRIITLFRSVDGALGELAQLKEDIRGLVDRYKQLAAQETPEGVVVGSEPLLRRDHLGASTFVEKGWSLIALGDPGGAIQALTRALELSPQDLQALSLLGWAEMQSGRLDDALATFSKVLVRDAANALARVNIGYICLKKRLFGESIEHLSRVIRLDNDPKAILYAHYYLGLVYLERGMFSDAQSFLHQALALGPNLIEAYHDLGRAQWLAGQRDEARATWTAGAGTGRLSPWARACQAMLDRVARGEEVSRSASS